MHAMHDSFVLERKAWLSTLGWKNRAWVARTQKWILNLVLLAIAVYGLLNLDVLIAFFKG